MYVIYVIGRPRPQILVRRGAGTGWPTCSSSSSATALTATRWCGNQELHPGPALRAGTIMGVGLFLGTQAAGWVMIRFSVNGRFQWWKIWLVPR